MRRCLKPNSHYAAKGALLAVVTAALAPVNPGWGSEAVTYEVDGKLHDSFLDSDVLNVRNLYNKTKPSLVFSCPGERAKLSCDGMAKYIWLLEGAQVMMQRSCT